MKGNAKKITVTNVRPPNPPWLPIRRNTSNRATLTFYYGDAKSLKIPIRDISNRKYAKPDPNIETLTYGLFSVCCKSERKSIVEKGISTQFFCTSRKDGIRVLTGYYRPAWYCKIGIDDYAIAAESARFISPGFVLSDLVSFLNGFPIDRFFRCWKYIQNDDAIRRLLLLINTAPNATAAYVSEIKRLEKESLEQYGHIYSSRLEGFSWKYASELMKKWNLL